MFLRVTVPQSSCSSRLVLDPAFGQSQATGRWRHLGEMNGYTDLTRRGRFGAQLVPYNSLCQGWCHTAVCARVGVIQQFGPGLVGDRCCARVGAIQLIARAGAIQLSMPGLVPCNFIQELVPYN